MNTKRYTISLSMVLALGVSTGAQADKSEWFDVISYGNTTIAQDSPEDFGPWKMMVQPAAGPAPLALATMDFPVPIPPTPTPIPVTPYITFEVLTATNVVAPPSPPPLVIAPLPPPPLTGLAR
ncbi:hypothetical protein SCD_n01301 [Sulfuricella denitrificans skB26]|uniref:Secreted protein n=1 Tax=Sulfuricella denitrificans (strain DSM 22764 / NBRC 105220 / skB26) TaxID=1163617 RepID=S6ABZ1_SULDS|nr:hypothetical protein [Sulfuricella denitrificans]BAN35128.1 hypothetical protein SCD_n01301 [Sulfuricella denitrificans skB26]